MKKLLRVPRRAAWYYTQYNLPRTAAALSYYMTMTFFPLIICLYSLLGQNYLRFMEALEFLSQFLSAQTTSMLRQFLSYVARSRNDGMFAAGLMLLLAPASAGVRTLQITIGEMQGGQRHTGVAGFLFGLICSAGFVGSIYFAIVVVFTGRTMLELLNGLLPFIDISSSWQWIRFLLLGGIVFVIVWAMYLVSKRWDERYITYPGALFATAAMVVMCYVFSAFIAVSARYPLVYGSLASIILLMFWLFLSCQIICFGAAINVAIRDLYARREREE